MNQKYMCGSKMLHSVFGVSILHSYFKQTAPGFIRKLRWLVSVIVFVRARTCVAVLLFVLTGVSATSVTAVLDGRINSSCQVPQANRPHQAVNFRELGQTKLFENVKPLLIQFPPLGWTVHLITLTVYHAARASPHSEYMTQTVTHILSKPQRDVLIGH